MMGMRSAIVIGATGLVGTALVRRLCESEEYIEVAVIARKALDYTHPKLEVKIRDFDKVTESDIHFAHEMFCCLGTTMKKAGSREAFQKVDYEYPMQFAGLAKNRGIAHFIVISAMGASDKAAVYYSRVKGKLEQDLAKLNFPRLSIVRPSLLVGKRDELRLGEKFGELSLRVLKPTLVGPLKKYRSIDAEQVALAMYVIALYGKPGAVNIYKSDELATMQLPQQVEEPPISREELFNWDKLKEEPLDVVDEEVVFDQSKIKTVDKE